MRAAIILTLALGASSAFAQDLSVYTGVAVGELDHRNETGGPFSQSVSSWKLYGGFQAGNHFSVEIGREWPGALSVDAPGGPLSIATRRFNVAYGADMDLLTLKVMGRLPFRRFDLWLGYGTYSMDADVDFEFTLNSIVNRTSQSVEDSGELVAVGIDWKLGAVDRPFDVRLEYESLGFPFSDASAIAVGVAFRFSGL